MFDNSPVTKKVLTYFDIRIGQYVAPIGLLKALSVHSAGSSYPRLPMLHEARSREWKTQTTLLAMRMFSKDMCIYIPAEETIHGIVEEYGTDVDGKCFLVNDGNLLFKSLATKSKERWLSAMSVLLTEGIYKYSSKLDRFTLRGRVSLIINIATPSFYRHKGEIFETTLGNRLFVVHSWLKEKENLQCKRRFDRTTRLKPHVFITERTERAIRNLTEYDGELTSLAKDYGALSVRSSAETLDIVKAIVSENARINDRNYICEDDIALVRMLRGYNIDPMVPDEPRVVGLLKEGRSFADICHLLNKPRNYYSTISYYKKKAMQKGALDVS